MDTEQTTKGKLLCCTRLETRHETHTHTFRQQPGHPVSKAGRHIVADALSFWPPPEKFKLLHSLKHLIPIPRHASFALCEAALEHRERATTRPTKLRRAQRFVAFSGYVHPQEPVDATPNFPPGVSGTATGLPSQSTRVDALPKSKRLSVTASSRSARTILEGM